MSALSKRRNDTLPVISIWRRVSMIFSVTSSGMCTSLLFCRLRVSSELRFSNTRGGSTLILEKII